MDKYAGPISYTVEPLNDFVPNEKKKRPANMERPKLKATDAQMRDYERNKPVNTPAGRARYADKAPKINIRKSYPE